MSSGIPQQILDQVAEADRLEAEEDARIAALENGTEPEPPAQPPVADPQQVPPPADPPPQAPAGPDGEVARLTAALELERKARVTAEQQYRSAQGILAKRDTDRDDEIRALKAQLTDIQTQIRTPQAPKERATFKHLSADERRAIEESGDPLEVRAIRGELEERDARYEQLVDERVKAAREEIRREVAEDIQRDAAVKTTAAEEGRFFSEVEKLSPGFMAEDANPEWARFLDLLDPKNVAGGTYRDRAERALAGRYPDGIAQLRNEYKALDPSGSREAALAAQVRPNVSQAVARPGAQQAQRNMQVEHQSFYTDQTRRGAGWWGVKADGKPRTETEGRIYQAELDDWYDKQQMGA